MARAFSSHSESPRYAAQHKLECERRRPPARFYQIHFVLSIIWSVCCASLAHANVQTTAVIPFVTIPFTPNISPSTYSAETLVSAVQMQFSQFFSQFFPISSQRLLVQNIWIDSVNVRDDGPNWGWQTQAQIPPFDDSQPYNFTYLAIQPQMPRLLVQSMPPSAGVHRTASFASTGAASSSLSASKWSVRSVNSTFSATPVLAYRIQLGILPQLLNHTLGFTFPTDSGVRSETIADLIYRQCILNNNSYNDAVAHPAFYVGLPLVANVINDATHNRWCQPSNIQTMALCVIPQSSSDVGVWQSASSTACTITDDFPSIGTSGLVIGVVLALVCLVIAFCVYYYWYLQLRRKIREEREAQSAKDGSAQKKKSIHDFNTPFRQQKFGVWTPEFTPICMITSYAFIGVLFIILSIVFITNDTRNVYQTIRYDNLPQCQIPQTLSESIANSANFSAYGQTLNLAQAFLDSTYLPFSICTVNVPIVSRMSAPVYLYYQLDNYFQNYRKYVQGRDDKQMRGDASTAGCKATITLFGDTEGHYPYSKVPPQGIVLSDYYNKTLYPCGAMAASFFSDAFFRACVVDSSGACVEKLVETNWQKDGIAWPSDSSTKYVTRAMEADETNLNPQSLQLMPPVNDSDFMVWARSAPQSTFWKLHRIISQRSLNAGETLSITVLNRFDVTPFNGEKHIVLATMTFMGTKNAFLGGAYLFFGCLFLVSAVLFHCRYRRIVLKN